MKTNVRAPINPIAVSGAAGGLPGLAYPTLATRRFQFRPLVLANIQQLAAIADEHRIADTSIGIPHPYTAEFARTWVSTHGLSWEMSHALDWAAHKIDDDRLSGYAGLNRIDNQRGQAELRFWVGCGVERHSDGTEWAEAIVEFALTSLKMTRVYALQLARHPLAGHILAGIGMREEGVVRKRIYRGGLVEDVICWSVSTIQRHPMSQVSC